MPSLELCERAGERGRAFEVIEREHTLHPPWTGQPFGFLADVNDRELCAVPQVNHGAIRGGDELGAELQNSPAPGIRLDDLDALAGHLHLPVGRVRARVELLQRREAVARRLQHLADQIPREIEIVPGDRQERADVGRPDRAEEIQQRAVPEEPGGKAGVGSEQDRVAAVDDPGVEMGHRHGRRADRRLAVHLGMMPLAHLRVIAAQPDAANRKPAVSPAFRNARGL